MQAFPKLGRAVVVAAALVLPSIALAEPAPGASEHPAATTKPKASGHAEKSHEKKEHKTDDAKKHAHEHAPKPETN